MDVTVTALRAELSTWIDHVRSGDEVVVTDRGVPVARLVAVDSAPLLERLTQQGVLGKPMRIHRPSARTTIREKATGPVADLVGEQRR